MLPGKRVGLLTLVIVLLCSLVLWPAYASENTATTSETVSPPQPIGKVSLDSNSYIELTEASILPYQDKKLVVFQIRLTNNRSSEINFIDYWVKVRAKNGTTYNVNMMKSDEDQSRIPAQSSSVYTFYSLTSKDVELSDLQFEFIQWDFAQADYQRTLGLINVPADYQFVTPYDGSKEVQLSEQPVETALKDVRIYQNAENYFVSLDLQLENKGNLGIQLPDLKYYIRTQEGYMYPVTAATEEALQLQPKVVKEFSMTASVPESIEQTEWQLIMLIQNPNDQIEVPVAFYEIPQVNVGDNYVRVGEKYPLQISGQEIHASVGQVVKSQERISVYVQFENTGSSSVDLPDYNYFVRTQSGNEYPLQNLSEASKTLNPKTKKEVLLQATLPVSVESENLDLLLKKAGNDYPEAIFNLSEVEIPADTSEIRYQNDRGVYGIKLDAVQRLPYGDEDLLAAKVTVINRSTSSLPILDLQAQFYLDSVNITADPVEDVQLDKFLTLQPFATTEMVFITKIPYTYEFEQLDLLIEEITKDGSISTVSQMNVKSTMFQLPSKTTTESITVKGIGKKAEAVVNHVWDYTNDHTHLVYVEVVLSNMEKRFTTLPALTGYFKTKDEVFFPANVTLLEDAVMPGGKVLLSFWSKVPKSINSSDLELILGQTMGDRGYANALSLSLPNEPISVPDDTLSELQISEYKFNINEFRAAITGTTKETQTMTVEFDYHLVKDYYEAYPDDHSIVLVIEDRLFKYEKALTFDELSTGTHEYKFSELTSNFMKAESNIFSQYTIRVYDEYKGHRRLVAQDTLDWERSVVVE